MVAIGLAFLALYSVIGILVGNEAIAYPTRPRTQFHGLADSPSRPPRFTTLRRGVSQRQEGHPG
jgi:hypothetical protein